MVCATQLDPNQNNQCFAASPVRARGCQIRAPKKGILGGLSRDSYPPHVTVYPYNGCIGSTNPIVRHVMSLTWTLTRICAISTRPKTCHNTTFTWLERARPSTKSRGIIGPHARISYRDIVTVNRCNGHITDTNLDVQRSNIL